MNEAVQLPALIDRASTRLSEARNSAEVLEARAVAQSALHYAKITKAANETQADCLRMIVRAEMRMADEIDRGQEEGHIQGAHAGVQSSDRANLEEVGVDKRRLSEWRQIRDAGEDVVESTIQRALDEGRAPSKNEINVAVFHHRTNGTGLNEWYTPPEYIESAREVLGDIDLDPASNALAQETVRAQTFFTEDDNGLEKVWSGRLWLNPPYSQPLISQFCEKLTNELTNGAVSAAITLTHNYTDTNWFHILAGHANAFCFKRGRIRFINQNGELASPTQGQVFCYFGSDALRFAQHFSKHGAVLCRM